MDKDDLFDLGLSVVYHLIAAFFMGYWYKEILFRCLPGMTQKESLGILWGLVIACAAIGAWVDSLDEPSVLAFISNCAAGFGIYTALCFMNLRKQSILTIIAVTLTAAFLYAAFIVCRKIKSRRKRKRILKRRIYRAIFGCKRILYFGMIAVLVSMGITPYLGKTLVNASVEPASKRSVIECWTIEGNIETLAKLYDDTWKTLSVEQKLNVLQVVANIERTRLKIPNELNVGAADLTGNTLGYYLDGTHSIVIRTDVLLEKSSYEAVHIVCHEANHSLEYRLVDAYDEVDEDLKNLSIFDSALSYKEEFKDYSDLKKDYYTYATMDCEMDSEAHAVMAAEEIYRAIYQYLGLPEQQKFSSCVRYDEQGNAYLLDYYGNQVAGPYAFIEDGSSRYSVRRYRNSEGLWGYMNSTGEEITPPKFVYCSVMKYGTALVREDADRVYFIDKDGERITRDYLAAEEFWYNSITKVMTEDGRWAIINKEDVTLYSGLEAIGKIEYGDCVISAMMDGHPALLAVYTQGMGKVELLAALDQYETITNMIDNRFAIVTDAKGNTGVISATGETVVGAKYVSVDYELVSSGPETAVYHFVLEKKNGTYDYQMYETK